MLPKERYLVHKVKKFTCPQMLKHQLLQAGKLERAESIKFIKLAWALTVDSILKTVDSIKT